MSFLSWRHPNPAQTLPSKSKQLWTSWSLSGCKSWSSPSIADDWGSTRLGQDCMTRWWQLKYFYFHSYLGRIPILTNIFQRGWNQQLDDIVSKTHVDNNPSCKHSCWTWGTIMFRINLVSPAFSTLWGINILRTAVKTMISRHVFGCCVEEKQIFQSWPQTLVNFVLGFHRGSQFLCEFPRFKTLQISCAAWGRSRCHCDQGD